MSHDMLYKLASYPFSTGIGTYLKWVIYFECLNDETNMQQQQQQNTHTHLTEIFEYWTNELMRTIPRSQFSF